AGGKFGGGDDVSCGGLDVVFSFVNTLSCRRMVVVLRRVGVCRRDDDGGGLGVEDVAGGEAEETGTTITFGADDEIIDETVYDFETLRKRFQQMAFLNKGLRLSLTDERTPKSDEVEDDDLVDVELEAEAEDEAEDSGPRTVTYLYERGLQDFVEFINTAKRAEVIHPELISFES